MKKIIWAIILTALTVMSMTSCEKDCECSFSSEMHKFTTGTEYKSWSCDGHCYMLLLPESDTLVIPEEVDSLIASTDYTGQRYEIHYQIIGDSVDLRYWFYK